MLDLQGFIEISALKDNTPKGVTSPVGEVSELSASYSRNKQYFAKLNKDVSLVTFTSKRDKADIEAPSLFTDHVLDVAQWIYSQSVLGIFKNDQVEFQRLLLAQFSTKISGLETGAMIQANGNWYPRWIGWKLEAKASEVANNSDLSNTIIIWFSDSDFNQNYTGYEIYVQMPVSPVDVLMGVKSAVSAALDKWNLPDHDDQSNVLANGIPPTARITHKYTWHDREDYNTTLPVDISLLVYGRAGLSTTAQKEAERQYILANSKYGQPEWVKSLPEIFTNTRFIFAPAWHVRGIPNEESVAAMYTPMVPYDFYIKAVSKFGSWKSQTAAEKNANKPTEPATDVIVTSSLYKSLGIVVVAGDQNDVNGKTLHQIVPDYALISTSNADISRISKKTTEWMTLLYKALVAAEEYHQYNKDLDIVKVVDENNAALYYWAFEYDNVEYRVVSRKATW